MNKKIITTVSLAVLLTLPVMAMAIVVPSEPGLTSVTIQQLIITTFAAVVWPILFAIIILYLLIVAFLFLSAQGDPGKVATARLALLWGLVGLVVLALAYSLPSIVKTTFGL